MFLQLEKIKLKFRLIEPNTWRQTYMCKFQLRQIGKINTTKLFKNLPSKDTEEVVKELKQVFEHCQWTPKCKNCCCWWSPRHHSLFKGTSRSQLPRLSAVRAAETLGLFLISSIAKNDGNLDGSGQYAAAKWLEWILLCRHSRFETRNLLDLVRLFNIFSQKLQKQKSFCSVCFKPLLQPVSVSNREKWGTDLFSGALFYKIHYLDLTQNSNLFIKVLWIGEKGSICFSAICCEVLARSRFWKTARRQLCQYKWTSLFHFNWFIILRRAKRVTLIIGVNSPLLPWSKWYKSRTRNCSFKSLLNSLTAHRSISRNLTNVFNKKWNGYCVIWLQFSHKLLPQQNI